MANQLQQVPVDDAVAEEEQEPTSVLDTILKRNERLNKTSALLGRVCVLGSVVASDPRKVVEWHSATVRKVQSTGEDETSQLTGLLLMYPGYFFHVLEGGLKTLTGFVQEYVEMAESGAIADEIKVLATTDDIPTRAFPAWSLSNVQSHSKNAGDVVVPGALKVSEAYIGVLNIGRSLQSVRKSERDGLLADLRNRHSDILPTQETITTLAMNEDAPTAAEWVDIFCQPISLQLDREVVWPLETELVY